MATSGRLRWPYPQGNKACGFACRAIDQVRASDQRSDRPYYRCRRAADSAGPRRRRDRMIRRREFITIIGGAAVASLPLAARAQQGGIRRIGVLAPVAGDDPDVQARHAAFVQGLEQLSWTNGRNLRIDARWGGGNPDEIRKYARELIALSPDVILASGSAAVEPLLQATRTVPIVFTNVPDPVGAGFVDSLARPGGNVTGFTSYEFGIGGKWLELLKQIAPNVTRAAVIRDPTITAGMGQWGAIQTAAPSFAVDVSPINMRDATDIERGIAAFARSPNG